LPALNKVKADIKGDIRFAETPMQKGTTDSNKKILLQNIQSNKFSNEVFKFYKNNLPTQTSHLHETMKDSQSNIDVSYSILLLLFHQTLQI